MLVSVLQSEKAPLPILSSRVGKATDVTADCAKADTPMLSTLLSGLNLSVFSVLQPRKARGGTAVSDESSMSTWPSPSGANRHWSMFGLLLKA